MESKKRRNSVMAEKTPPACSADSSVFNSQLHKKRQPAMMEYVVTTSRVPKSTNFHRQTRKLNTTMADAIANTTDSSLESAEFPEADMEISSGGKKKGRGPTKPLDLEPGQKLVVQFNELMQPIGDKAPQFGCYLGNIAKNGVRLPLTYTSWANMPRHSLEYVWQEIQENTTAPPGARNYCLTSVADKWRKWKNYLKNKYYKDQSEESLSNIPERVNPEQWRTLVRYWSLPKVQSIAEKNKTNREKQGPIHRTGRTSMPTLREQMRAEGKATDRLSVYIRARTTSDEKRSEEAKRIIEQMEDMLSEASNSEAPEEARERVFSEFMGKENHGRMRTMGLGVAPTKHINQPFGQQSTQDFVALIKQQIEAEVMEKVKDYVASLESEIALLKEKVAESNVHHQAEVRTFGLNSPAVLYKS